MTMLERNPVINFHGTELQFIGDTHLGKTFKNNVLLTRRGEYEALQYQVLTEKLTFKPDSIAEFIRCQVGDWFDKSVVSINDVLKSYQLLKDYETDNIEPLFILSGNHDDSKSITEPTSWDLLAKFFEESTTVKFIKRWLVHTLEDGSQILFVGWNIHDSVAISYVQALEAGFNKIRMVVCHLDRVSYGDDSNVIPYDFLIEKGVECVVSGHEHKPYQFHDKGLQVIGTGSMLPYTHAEDPECNHFITFKSLEEMLTFGLENLKDKHVRIYTDDIEGLPEVDCISLQVNRVENNLEIEDIDQVVIESYDAKSIWDASAKRVGLLDDMSKQLWSEIKEKGVEE